MFIHGHCAYSLALEHLRKGPASLISNMESAETLNLLELYVLLKNNLRTISNQAIFQKALNDVEVLWKLKQWYIPNLSLVDDWSVISQIAEMLLHHLLFRILLIVLPLNMS